MPAEIWRDGGSETRCSNSGVGFARVYIQNFKLRLNYGNWTFLNDISVHFSRALQSQLTI
jgi:hypothetical protein